MSSLKKIIFSTNSLLLAAIQQLNTTACSDFRARRLCMYMCLGWACMLSSCHALKPAHSDEGIKPEAALKTDTRPSTQVLSILLSSWHNADSSVHFKIYNTQMTAGKLKTIFEYEPAFLIDFKDASGKTIDTFLIRHPLRERLEIEDEKRALSSKMHVKDTGYSNLRINYSLPVHHIVIIDLKTKQQQILNLN